MRTTLGCRGAHLALVVLIPVRDPAYPLDQPFSVGTIAEFASLLDQLVDVRPMSEFVDLIDGPVRNGLLGALL
ncbi:MAG: hypothetical protein HKN80_00470 [Acidimicrobiia bacterium]|nr:hypothetical protein [Acidimicrobiia bacterium]